MIHCSTIRLPLHPAPQITRPHPLLIKRSFNNRSVTPPSPLPSLYAAAFVRRTTSSTDLHPLLKRSLYFLRILSHYILYFIRDVEHFLKGVCYNTRTLLSYIRFSARTCKRIYRLMTKTHPPMHIIVLKSKTHPSMHIIVLKFKSHRCGKTKTHRFGKIQDIKK